MISVPRIDLVDANALGRNYGPRRRFFICAVIRDFRSDTEDGRLLGIEVDEALAKDGTLYDVFLSWGLALLGGML